MSKRHGQHMLTTSTSLASERWDNKRKHSKNKKAQLKQPSVEKTQSVTKDSKQIEQQYRKAVRELNIGVTLDLRTFFNLFYMVKPRLKTADIIQTEEVLLSMWKAGGGIQNKYIDQKVVYQLYLYTQNALQNELEITKKLDRFMSHPIFTKKEVSETKKIVRHPDSVEINIKIRDNVWQKVRITPSTSIDDLVISISLKHSKSGCYSELSSSKVKLLKKLMSAHIKKQLTRITQQSLETLSDLSGVFDQLD